MVAPNGEVVVDSATANPHLNVFDPYRDLGRTHEDQLTRAAMIVLRLVPLARETLLRSIGEPSQSELPDCTVDMQATHIVDASEESAAGGEVKRGRLVSVFLTPDTEPAEGDGEVKDTSRGQRFDGVLRFDPELVVLLESKVCTRWARRNGHRVGELNLGSARFAQRRTCVLRWHDLLESWWRLVELAVLSPAERALVQDLLTYAHQDFGHLLPFGSLRRVGADPVRRKWRLRSLLREATGLQPERVGLAHVRLDTALGVISMQRAALDLDGDELILHFWPGELKRQAEHLYGAGHAERLPELCSAPTEAAGAGAWSPSHSWASATPPRAPASTSPRAWTPPPTSAAGRARTSSRWGPTTPTRSSPSCGRGCCAAATPPRATKRAWNRSCARSGAAPPTCAPASTCRARGRSSRRSRSTTRACSRGRSTTRSTACSTCSKSRCILLPTEAPEQHEPPPETAGAAARRG